jgi:short-subunit dehydrogenase
MGKDEGGKGGVVVNICSIMGFEAYPACPIYVAMKHVVISLNRSFGLRPAHSNVDILYQTIVALVRSILSFA